jgi:hypothetical protein
MGAKAFIGKQMKKQPGQTGENQHPIHSRTYILRLWRADEPRTAEWHASLEDPFTKERFGFASMEQLFAFLMEVSEKDSGMPGGISTMERGG